MFGFISKFFRKKPVEENKPETKKPLSKALDVPDTVLESRGSINWEAGHIDFGKTKSITRSFKRSKIRDSFEERRNRYYDRTGRLFEE